MSTPWTHILKKVDDYRWEIPTSYKPGMRVPGLVFADERMLRQIVQEQALEQVANVATLPGIVQYSLAMPDIHWGYGFPVGGVAGFDLNEGIISPGSIGFDINCGVRLIRTDLREERGRGQIGTLGSGNHFLEVQVVDQVYDRAAAQTMEIGEEGQVVVFVHCGSRGLGHQVCTDYLRTADRSAREHGITLVDRQLACMPFKSPEGQEYLSAMSAAANFAWANRQMIMHWVREAFSSVFAQSAESLGMHLVYDVAHNIGKVEEYEVNGQQKPLVVHRKGATRAFPPGHPEIPAKYKRIGQPVLIPGDMGRYSFIAVGTEEAMRLSFGSTCHGAGRVMGRKQAVRTLAGVDVAEQLRQQGILVRAQDRGLLAEEAPAAYKDVADVVGVCQAVGISRRVARARPLGVVKG